MMILSQYHIFELDTINIYSVVRVGDARRFTNSTVTYKVVYAPATRANTPLLFLLYPLHVLCAPSKEYRIAIYKTPGHVYLVYLPPDIGEQA